MPTITLPALPGPNDATPRFLSWGSDQKPVLGGATSHIDRLGSRWALDVKMPPMPVEPDGRVWVSRLVDATEAGAVLFEWPQLSFPLAGFSGTGLIRAAAAAGTAVLPVQQVGVGATFREGQFISVIRAANGRRYLYKVKADTVANGLLGGSADLPVSPMIRAGLAVADVVEIAVPKIEGRLVGNEREWNLNNAHHAGLAFTVEEIE